MVYLIQNIVLHNDPWETTQDRHEGSSPPPLVLPTETGIQRHTTSGHTRFHPAIMANIH